MMPVAYEGLRTEDGCRVWVTDRNGHRLRPLPPRFDLRRHSPDGYEWGYSGSGPAQLALALCAHALVDHVRAQVVYQDFKRSMIATLDKPEWKMTRAEILTAVQEIEMKRAEERA